MNWTKKKIGDITEVITKGTTPTTIGFSFTDEGINFVKIECITDDGNFLLKKMEHIPEECNEKMKRSQLKENDILFSIAGAIGRTAIVPKTILPANTNQALAIIRLNTNQVLPEFLVMCLKSEQVLKQFEKKKQGVAQLNLSLKDIAELEVAYPDILQQKRVLSVLKKAQELVDKRKKQIQACDELIKSQFIEMFGDPITNSKELPRVALGKICNMKAGKSIKAADIFESCNDGMFPCYGGNGLRGYVKDYLHEGNIPLIGRQGALCGNVQFAQGKFYATEHAIVTQPKVELNTCWLFIMLREMNLNRLASGAAQPGLNVSTLVPLEVIMPPIELQNEFATFVKQVDKLKFGMEQSLKKLEDNFDSLMQRAFKGELF